MEDPVWKEGRTVECGTPKVPTLCSHSEDGENRRRDGANDYAPLEGNVAPVRRKRKTTQPKRAAMYGSEVQGGVWCDTTDDSKCHSILPVKQHIDVPHTPLTPAHPMPAVLKPAPAASQSVRSSSSAEAKHRKKSSSPGCGPCCNCGTSVSPQWRRGNNEKPIVCNACGIRFLRTRSFDKQSEKKRAASGGAGVVSGDVHQAKRHKANSQPTTSEDSCPVNNNSPDAVISTDNQDPTDSRKRRRSSPSNTEVSNAASLSASPSVTSLVAEMAPTPINSLKPNGPCTNNAAGSSAYAANHHAPAEQQHVPASGGKRSRSGRLLRPSPLGRLSMPADAPAIDAPAPGQPTSRPAPPALGPVGEVSGGTSPIAAPMASIPCMAAAAGPINSTAAGTATFEGGIQPELLHMLRILAPTMGSFDAATAYLMASAGGVAASGSVLPMAGVPGQGPAHIWW